MISVNVLLYGDYPHYAQRCLNSIARTLDPGHVSDVRVGLNDVSRATLANLAAFGRAVSVPVYAFAEANNRNVLKYPMMRRMFYSPSHPIAVTKVMWFDDDSFVKPETKSHWWAACEQTMDTLDLKLVGSMYRPRYVWTVQERAKISQQPWYVDGSPLTVMPRFATGGWWTADLAFLRQWDYPVRELRNNGGDVLLGEICRQTRVKIDHLGKAWVAINTGDSGRESGAARRGVTTPRPYQEDPPADLHDFECRIVRVN